MTYIFVQARLVKSVANKTGPTTLFSRVTAVLRQERRYASKHSYTAVLGKVGTGQNTAKTRKKGLFK